MSEPWYRWPPGLRQTILTRDHHTCQIHLPGCTYYATQIDHIRPVSQGGQWFTPTNLRAACNNCNQTRKGQTPPPTTITPPDRW